MNRKANQKFCFQRFSAENKYINKYISLRWFVGLRLFSWYPKLACFSLCVRHTRVNNHSINNNVNLYMFFYFHHYIYSILSVFSTVKGIGVFVRLFHLFIFCIANSFSSCVFLTMDFGMATAQQSCIQFCQLWNINRLCLSGQNTASYEQWL